VHGELAERVFVVLRDADPEAAREFLDEGSTWELPGRSSLAGVHTGPEAIVALLARLTELRPIREDAYDVMTSEHHATLTTRLVGNGLDSDHAIVVVARDGILDRAFHYLFDAYAFDRHFAH
jgi:ketosteroid isomerase-like protein